MKTTTTIRTNGSNPLPRGGISVPNGNNRPTLPAPPTPEPVVPEIIDIEEGQDLILGSDKKSTPRIKGLHVARLAALKLRPSPGGKGHGDRVILRFELEGLTQESGGAYTADYECPATWKPTSELQRIAPMLLGRPLERSEVVGSFNLPTLRGQRCRLYVTEHRSRATDTAQSVSTLTIGEIHSLGTSEDAPENIPTEAN